MNVVSTLFIAGLLSLSAQALGQTRITISEKKAPLDKIFHQVEKQSGYSIWYEKVVLEKTIPIDIKVKNAGLEETLDLCCLNQPIAYSIVGKMVVIRSRENQPHASPPFALLHGKVLNEKGEALSGATIQIKGMDKAVFTDTKGFFVLTGITGLETIIVSNIGYEVQDVQVANRPQITIHLMLNVSKLDEVEVIAYGTVSKRLNTGSVSRINRETIEKQPVTNLLSALSGRTPGVFVQTTNGLPGGNIKVQVRGTQSIAAGNDPLYIIDGIPFSSASLNSGNSNLQFINGPSSTLNSINPADIESVTVLKDADATAIYGSRAANGVILITTKKGKEGKTVLDASVYHGTSSVSRFSDFLSLNDYLAIRREGFKNDNVIPTVNNAPDLLVWDTTNSTDWQRWFLGNSSAVTDAQLSLSGGNAGTHFLLGLNYNQQGSVLRGDQSYQRGGGHLNIEHVSTNRKFTALVSTSYTADDNKLIKAPGAVQVATLPPNFPMYNMDGSINWSLGNINPIGFLKQKAVSKTNSLVISTNLQYMINTGLRVKVNAGFTKTEMNMLSTIPASSYKPFFGSPVSQAFYGNNYTTTVIAEPQLEYNKKYGQHAISLLAGSSWQSSTTQGYYINGSNYANENTLENLSAAGTITGYGNNYSEYRYLSFFGRAGYNFLQKYLVNINFRRDGSTRFGTGNRWGNFGAIGAAWIFSKEKFFSTHHSMLSFGKLKASYGVTGNDQITDYQYLSVFGNSVSYQGTTTLSPQNIANMHYNWETTNKFNAGIELGFIKDKILLSIEYYANRSGNQLVAYPLPATSGPFGSYQVNLPALVQNNGIEVTLNTENIHTKKFVWTTDFNITVPKNKLSKYPGLAISPYANTYAVGEDLSNTKAYVFTGVNPTTGVAGFEDLNKDGLIKYPDDYAARGKLSPYYYGGFNNGFDYKGLRLDIFFQFVKQDALTNLYNYVPGSAIQNYLSIALNRWQKPGDITNVQAATVSSASAAYKARSLLNTSSAAITDGSYMRLKNISISYAIPAKIISRWKLQQLKVFFTAQNLYTFTRIKDADPEVINGTNYTVPVLKTITGGIHITL